MIDAPPSPPRIRTAFGTGKDLGLAPPLFAPRLLFVSSSSADGGADRLPVELAHTLKQRGARVDFACRPDRFTAAWCQAAGIDTVPFNIRNSGDFRAARRMARLIIARSVDVVHVHARRDFMVSVMGAWLARPERRLLGAPAPRVVLHSHLLRPLGEPPLLAGKFFAAGADAVIAVSRATETFLNTQHRFAPGLVRRITNGVNDEFFAPLHEGLPCQSRQCLRREWGIGANDVVVGMVGRLFQKGQTHLLAAVARLVDHPGLRVVLVGPERDPGDGKRIMALARRMGLHDRLVIGGARKDIPACLAAFDVLAHLPHDEAFGLALAEAMASGLPVIASDADGCRDVLGTSGGRGGQMVAAGDVVALTHALTRLLDPIEGAKRRATEGWEARRVAGQFSRARQVDQLMALYAELCLPAAP